MPEVVGSEIVVHPWPELLKEFPPLSLTQMEALRESIATYGLKYPIKVLPDGRIIDGYHRWLILGDKTPYEVIDVDEETAIGIARVLNLARRQLSAVHELIHLCINDREERIKVATQRIAPYWVACRKYEPEEEPEGGAALD